jgi:enamine deaminase RidA (YjgF/YER057c/UK114 family)
LTDLIEQRLAALGIVLPVASSPAANYVNTVLVNGLLFVSGKAPSAQNGIKPKGKLGKEYTTEQGYQFARQTAIEVLAVLKAELGSLDRIKRVVKVQSFINADPGFEEHHKVMNGFSDLMMEVFGDRGTHARSGMGASSLRDNLPLVVDSIFEVTEA